MCLEVADQASGRPVVDIRRVDAGGIAVLGELFFLESLVVGTRVVVRIGTRPWWVTQHTVARCTPPGTEKYPMIDRFGILSN